MAISRFRSFLFLFLAMPLAAQTAQVQPMPVQIPAVVDPGWTLSCTVPKNGGKCTITQPQRTLLKAGQSMTPATTAPVTLGNYNMTFTLTPAQLAQIQAAMASGSGSVTGITITLKAVK